MAGDEIEVEGNAPGQAAPVQHRKANYVVRHWRGELSLATSYWVNGFLASIFGAAAVAALTVLILQIRSNHVALMVAVSMWVVVLVVTLWQLVGIWRSASRPGADGKTSRWAGLAKVGVVAGLLRTALEFGQEGVPMLTAAARQGTWLQDNGRWEVRVKSDGTEIEFSGGIGHGFAADLEAALAANPDVRLVHLNLGKGGLLAEADRAFRVIRKRGLPTYVAFECNSACTHVFLAGRQRFLEQGARLGFHAPSSPFSLGRQSKSALEDERRFLVAAGVAPAFAARAVGTPHDEMWFPTLEELVDGGVVTRVTPGAAGP